VPKDVTVSIHKDVTASVSKKGEKPMFIVAVVICLLVFAALASADLLVSNLNSDELSNMGVERRS
jgi:hypothetical protein